MVLAEALPLQFYIQLVYRDTLNFTPTSKNLSCSEFGTKQEYFVIVRTLQSIQTILSDCHILDEIKKLLNAFRLKENTSSKFWICLAHEITALE